MMKNILIIGASSAIAEATARIYAREKCHFYLIARDNDRLESIKSDLIVRGAQSVEVSTVDFQERTDYHQLIKHAFDHLETVDIVLIAHGTLPDQYECQSSIEKTLGTLNLNALSTIALLTEITNLLEIQKKGTVSVITSVAGDRGRQSNYIYGSAKGMISIFLQGLRNRLQKSNVHVLDIKPGFVDTPMTASFQKGILWSNADTVAKSIVRAIDKKKNTVYAPSFWRVIMVIIRLIPEFIFKKLNL